MRSTAGRRPLSLSFAASAAIQALNVASGVMLARALGPHGRGELAAVMLWPGLLAAIGSLGVGDGITYHTARAGSRPGTVLGSGLALCVPQSAVLVAAGFITVSFTTAHHQGATTGSAYLFLLYIPTYLAATYLMAALNGICRHAWFQGLRLLVVALSAAGVAALAVLGSLTARSAVLVYIAAHLTVLMVAFACWLRTVDLQPRVEASTVRSLVSFGVRSHGGTLAGTLNERLDQLLISVFLAPASLGLYVIAVTLTSVTGLVGASASLVVLPAVARLPPGAARARSAWRTVAATLLGSVAVTVPVFAVLPQLIALFFGGAYGAAVPFARVLLVAAVLLSTNRVLGAILRAVGRPLDAGAAELLALGTTVVGLAALLPLLGLMGAALTSLLAYAVSTAWMARRAIRALGPSALPSPAPGRKGAWLIRAGRLPSGAGNAGEGTR